MKKETKDSKKKNTSKMPIIIISIALIITIIIGKIFLVKKNDKKDVENVTNASEGTTNPEDSISLIDMNNTANAEVVDGAKQNTSSALKENKQYKGMDVKDIKLNTEGGLTNFTATIENNSGSDFAGGAVVLIFTNQDGSEYARLEGIIPEVSNGGSTVLDTGTTSDIANAYDFTIESAK